MFIEIAKLLATKELTFDRGKITFLREPLFMLPLDTLLDFQRLLEKDNLQNLLYYSARETGSRWFELMVDHYNMDYEDIIKWGVKKIDLAGLGRNSVKRIDLKAGMALNELKDSSFAKLYVDRFGKASYCVDNIYRGYVAGAGKLIFNGRVCHAIEVKCIAKGDSVCEFVVKPIKEFDYKRPLIKEQLYLPKKFQEDIEARP